MTELERVTRENIRQPLQDAKTVYNAKRYQFHGSEMVLDMFPNKWGVYPGGVGLCANRCKHVLRLFSFATAKYVLQLQCNRTNSVD